MALSLLREVATIAALTALGNAGPQLKVHIHAGLNVGLKRDEGKGVIIQMNDVNINNSGHMPSGKKPDRGLENSSHGLRLT